MKRSDCQVKGITTRIVWHHVTSYVRLYRFDHGIVDIQQRETRYQCQHVAPLRELASPEFGFHRKARHEFVSS